ncbi:MAG: redoxin domain-containing protein [Clostridiales Family XIII bacterium]|jgi:peroxiredoxin|nr:redoxin domain-containing protein [Clostridiales Family XIII bacterium]
MKMIVKKRISASLCALLVFLLAATVSGCGGARTAGAASGGAEAAGGGAESAGGANAAEEAEAGIDIGQIAPNFTLDLRGGGTVSLWDLRGKPVFLNVSATWCPPCQKEFPEVQAAYELYGEDVHFLGVDIGEPESEVDAYFDGFDCDYPMAYDPSGTISADYGIEFIPQTWVLDADGVVVDYISGGATLETFRDSIEKALDR